MAGTLEDVLCKLRNMTRTCLTVMTSLAESEREMKRQRSECAIIWGSRRMNFYGNSGNKWLRQQDFSQWIVLVLHSWCYEAQWSLKEFAVIRDKPYPWLGEFKGMWKNVCHSTHPEVCMSDNKYKNRSFNWSLWCQPSALDDLSGEWCFRNTSCICCTR